MGFFKDEEIGGLRVTKMIIHVVKHGATSFVPQPEIPVQEEGFFRARILDEGADGVHQFDPESKVKDVLQKIARSEMTFEAGGQNLAERFYSMHMKQMAAGAFFVIELRPEDAETVFYALIKYDYREAIELTEADGKSVLRAVVQAFVRERKSIQKICLVRVVSGKVEVCVSARDRMKEAPDLTDYFERYLEVTRAVDNVELSRRLNEAMRETLESLKDYLPNRDVPRALAAAKTALSGRATVTNDDVLDSIFHAANRPAAENIREDFLNKLTRQLKRQKLVDVDFTPDQKMLKVLPRRVVRTAEEVVLEFPQSELGHSVVRKDVEDQVIFTITTKRLVQDGTLKDKTS